MKRLHSVHEDMHTRLMGGGPRAAAMNFKSNCDSWGDSLAHKVAAIGPLDASKGRS